MSDDPTQDVLRLRRHILAQEDLLACYRLQTRPSERLFAELDRTRKWARKIFVEHGLETADQ